MSVDSFFGKMVLLFYKKEFQNTQVGRCATQKYQLHDAAECIREIFHPSKGKSCFDEILTLFTFVQFNVNVLILGLPTHHSTKNIRAMSTKMKKPICLSCINLLPPKTFRM